MNGKKPILACNLTYLKVNLEMTYSVEKMQQVLIDVVYNE